MLFPFGSIFIMNTGSYAFCTCYIHVSIHISAPECLLFIWISFLKFIVNWRIIALQYCIGFCHISTWVCHRYTYVLSLLNLLPTLHSIPPSTPSQPSRLSQSTRSELHVLYSKCPLAIWFYTHNVCVSGLVSPFGPPSSSLCIHKLVLYDRLSIAAPQIGSSVTIFLDSIYIYINIWYLSFSFCTSSCTIGSRSVKWLHSWSSSIRLLITKILEHWQGILFLLSSIISPVPFSFCVILIISSFFPSLF